MSQAPDNFKNLAYLLKNIVIFIQEFLQITDCLLLQLDAEMRVEKYYCSTTTLESKKLLETCCQIAEHHQDHLQINQDFIFLEDDFSACSCSVCKAKIQSSIISSLLIIPLCYQDSYLGAIFLLHRQREHRFNSSKLKLVRAMALQSARAIYEVRSLGLFRSQNYHYKLLTKINELLNSPLDSEALFKNILSLIGFFFGVEHIFLLDLREEKNQLISTWNLGDKKNTGFQEHIQEIAYFEIKKQKFTYQFCIKNNPKIKNKFIKSKRYSCINIPIYTRQDFFGSLILKTEQYTRTFSPAEIQTLECVAHQTAIALYQLQIQEREQTAAAEQPTDCAVLARREFFSHMTHELRTPLTGILGFSRLLQDEIYGTLNLKQKQYVNGIATSGEHLLSLVNDFLDLSKIEANREELYLETVAVEDICLAAMAIVQPRATEGRLTLHLEIDPDVDFCKVDQRRLKQILVNLLSNAIKFTEVGSVTLQVKRDQNLLKLSVIDTGIGINPEDQQKLFQPFQQIHNHLSRKHKGTGLGLLLSRKLAQLHGGDITLNSEKGKGSCFTVHIPIR